MERGRFSAGLSASLARGLTEQRVASKAIARLQSGDSPRYAKSKPHGVSCGRQKVEESRRRRKRTGNDQRNISRNGKSRVVQALLPAPDTACNVRA